MPPLGMVRTDSSNASHRGLAPPKLAYHAQTYCLPGLCGKGSRKDTSGSVGVLGMLATLESFTLQIEKGGAFRIHALMSARHRDTDPSATAAHVCCSCGGVLVTEQDGGGVIAGNEQLLVGGAHRRMLVQQGYPDVLDQLQRDASQPVIEPQEGHREGAERHRRIVTRP